MLSWRPDTFTVLDTASHHTGVHFKEPFHHNVGSVKYGEAAGLATDASTTDDEPDADSSLLRGLDLTTFSASRLRAARSEAA